MYLSVWVRPVDKRLVQEISTKIREYSGKYDTYTNLNEWKGPHTTIYTMKMQPRDRERAIGLLKSICSEMRPIRVQIKDTGYFMKRYGKRMNYVIYLKVIKGRQLGALWQRINKKLRKYKANNLPFVPHMTLAYHDLSKENFNRALRENRGFRFSGSFTVNKVMVSYRIRGRRRVVIAIKMLEK